MIGSLAVLIGASLALLAPGIAWALCWRPRDQDGAPDGPLGHILLALAVGFGLVPFAASTFALFARTSLTKATVLAAVLLATLAAGFRWWRGGRRIPPQLRRGWREAALVLAAATLIGAVYFLKYDRSVFFAESCINRVSLQLLQVSPDQVPIIASNEEDQRLGNVAVVASIVALVERLGFRLLHGLMAFFMAAGAYLLGRRGGRHPGYGWGAMLLLTLNPYVLGLPYTDENLLVLGFSTLLLPLVLRPGVPWASAGAIFGLIVMMRHVMLLAAPALIWLLWFRASQRRAALFRSFVAFNAVTILAHVHHYLALGSIFRMESHVLPPTPHRFVGAYRGLLQWPFADEILRTPWNPLPTFLMWPAFLADRLGLLVMAALVVGLVVLVRRHRVEGIFWLLWFAPVFLGLSVQENWDVPNKMGIILIVFVPVAVWAMEGCATLARKPLQASLILLATGGALWGGLQVISGVETRADHRYYQIREGLRPEDPTYVAAQRRQVTSAAPWPDYSTLDDPTPFWQAGKFADIGAELRDRSTLQPELPYSWHEGDAADLRAAPVTVEIELSRRWQAEPSQWIRRVKADDAADIVHIDLTTPGPPVVVHDLPLAATSEAPVTLVTTRGGAALTGLMLLFEDWRGEGANSRKLHREHSLATYKLLGLKREDWQDHRSLRTVQAVGTRIRLRVPPGPLTIAESINVYGQRYLVWRARVQATGPMDTTGPHTIVHN